MDLFDAISDPTRRRIIQMLAGGDRCAGDIVKEFNISAPAISQHLRILRNVGLVSVRVDAQRRIHSFNPKALEGIDRWLNDTRSQLSDAPLAKSR